MHEFYPWPFPSEFSSFHHNGNLNFQSGSENFSPPIHSHSSDSRTAQLIHETEDSKDGTSKKTVRDPLSHRIIEKRRRDRMNNCLADLSKLIPTSYLKKGRGRIEKTEVIEMAIKHVKHLEAHNKVNCVDINRCELRATEEEKKEEFRHGFREATSEVMRFLVEMRGLYPGDALCQGLVGHLRDHLAKILPGTPGEMLFRGRSGSEVRGRSASISSVLSEGTTRSGSTPTPTKNGAETMETESIDSHRLPKIEGASRLRDMLRTEIDGERISNGVCAVSACNGGAGGEEENTSASSSLVAKAIPSCPKNRENGAVNGLNRPTSVSPSSECYRSFKKGIRERFQSDMRQEYKQSCTNIASQSSDSANTQGSSNFSLGSSSECQSKGSHQDPKVASSSSISPPFHHQLNGSKVFKYKEKVITSIPAFALHPNGSFYIPLTINPSLISHWFACPETEDLFSVLHPVNIPVNFSYIQRLNQLYPINTNPASYSSESHHSRQQGNQQILLTAN